MTHELTMAHNGQTIRVAVGDTLQLRLEENPTTGYAWAFETPATVAALQHDAYAVLPGTGIGGGGLHSFTFHIAQPGQETVRLKNWQRWSGDVYQQFSVSIQAV